MDTSEELPSPQCDSLASWATQSNRTERLPGFHSSSSTSAYSSGLLVLFSTVSFDPQNFAILKSGLKGEMPELRIFTITMRTGWSVWSSPVALPRKSFYCFPVPLSCAFSSSSQQVTFCQLEPDHRSWNTHPCQWACPSQFHKPNPKPIIVNGSTELILLPGLPGSDLCIKHNLIMGMQNAFQDCILGFH